MSSSHAPTTGAHSGNGTLPAGMLLYIVHSTVWRMLEGGELCTYVCVCVCVCVFVCVCVPV